MYSGKGDSFALGVLVYYILAGRHPWRGKDKEELVRSYHNNRLNEKPISLLPPRIKHNLRGLLQIDP